MRDPVKVAEDIKRALKSEPKGYGKKREFMQQLNNFIKDTRFYPPEATYPWDKLGAIAREYLDNYDNYEEWKQIAMNIIKGERNENIN